MPKKIIVSLILGGFLSAATLYLAFRNVPVVELAAYLGTISYGWVVPSIALGILTFVLRVYRWRLILKTAVSLKFWQAFHPLMIGFMMNCILPGRVGEIARPVILKKETQVPVTTGLATVAVERVFDIVMLIILFAVVFSTVSSRPDLDITFGGWHLNGQILQSAALAMIRISIALLIGLALFAFSLTRRWITRTIDATVRIIGLAGPGIHRHAQRGGRFINGMVESFAEGLSLVGQPIRALTCFGLTVAIWGISALSLYVFAMGCPGVDLSFMEITTVMVVVCFFIALPSVPGFWGLWEAGGIFALSLFGVATKDAAGFTLVNHAAQIFPVILIGLVSALVTSVNIWQLTFGAKLNRTVEPATQRNAVSEPS